MLKIKYYLKYIVNKLNNFKLIDYPDGLLKFIEIKQDNYFILFILCCMIIFTEQTYYEMCVTFVIFSIYIIFVNMLYYIQQLQAEIYNLKYINEELNLKIHLQNIVKHSHLIHNNTNIFNEKELKFLLKIAHPDKNNNSKISNNTTAKLLSLLKKQ